ncbi:hypothetical protein [Terrimonas sp.]|uniref:hypothetical protein n=1 Tax=Terrimonas sp. TaxID=1914338 RepID=UPI00105754EF|nr:hypothetical protein [Terrimonas sp.]
MKTSENFTNTTNNLHSSSEPFTLYLDDEPYILTKSAIKEQLDPGIQRSKEAFWPSHIKLLSQSGQTLILQLKDKKTVQQITVLMEPDKLQFSCNCNTMVKTVCIHVCRTLSRLLPSNSTDYFEQYSPQGIGSIAVKHPAYFDKHTSSTFITYSPKKREEDIYRFSQTELSYLTADHFKLPASTPKPIRDKEALFIILTSYRRERLPAIIPCAGLLTKDREGIKQFLPFLSGADKKDGLMTGDQHQLTSLGLAMWKLVEKLPGSFRDITAEHEEELLQLFTLWEEALPILSRQQRLYSYRLGWVRDLKRPPHKQDMYSCRISMERPVLSFVLKDCGACYHFYPELHVRGKCLSGFLHNEPFIVSLNAVYYLLSSLRDAALVELVEKQIVFKEQFAQFEQEILAPIKAHYKVNLITQKPKRK